MFPFGFPSTPSRGVPSTHTHVEDQAEPVATEAGCYSCRRPNQRAGEAESAGDEEPGAPLARVLRAWCRWAIGRCDFGAGSGVRGGFGPGCVIFGQIMKQSHQRGKTIDSTRGVFRLGLELMAGGGPFKRKFIFQAPSESTFRS